MATISVEDLKKMKVNDLKKELKDRGLPVSGTKDVLLERMQAALDGAPIPEGDGAPEAETEAADASDDQQVDSVEKSIDQLVGDAAPPAKPVESVPAVDSAAAAVTSKENIPKTDSEPEEKKVVPLKGLSDAERMKARAAKFGGAVSETAKKQMRAERFGIPVSGPTGATGKSSTEPADVNKLKQRAERFGTVVSNTLSKSDEEERKRKRLERFGAVAAPSATSASDGAKKVKLNSTDSDLEAKKKQRAARFGLTT